MENNLIPHVSNQVPADMTHFWVVTVISNSPRYRRRFELYHAFEKMIKDTGVNLVTVELAFGDRQFMITDSSNPNHLQLRSFEELFHKENLINLGIRHARKLDPLADKVAWIDADMRPARPARQWLEETWHELQHYKFVQMYSEFYDLDYNSNLLGGVSNSFMGAFFKHDMTGPIPNQNCMNDLTYCFVNHLHHRRNPIHNGRSSKGVTDSGGNVWFGPPGGAWAADIEALDSIGMLPDFCILGSGDWHLATALVHGMSPLDPEMVNNRYSEKLFSLQTRCDNWIKQDVGVVMGAMFHDNHGKKVNRKYGSRKQILTRNQYNPSTDIKYDSQGVIQLETSSTRQIRLRDEIRNYFRERNEDEPEYKK